MVLAPSVIRPGLPYGVWLHLLGDSGIPVDNIVRLSVRDKDNQTLGQAFAKNVPVGTQRPLLLKALPIGLSPSEAYSVYVKGEDLGGRLLFEAAADVRLEPKASSLFVQTDKAIYKPGSDVHLRVLAVDPNLLPLNASLDVKIYVRSCLLPAF